MDSPYDDHPSHSLPPPGHLSHLSRNLSGMSVNSSAASGHTHHPDRPFGLRISTSVSNPGSHNASPSMPPSRKRSFTSNPPSLPSLSTSVMGGMVPGSATPLIEEDISGRGMDLDLDYEKYDKYHEPKYEKYDPDLPPNSALTSGPPSALPMSGSRGSITPGGGTSPIDGVGSGSGGSGEEGNMSAIGGTSRGGHGSAMSTGMGLMGKPMPTNNFVTKLYQMINDPKSAHFIAWTEHGTSFVVSNVGEFSRSILGSHFKHNNFSSFVRQLNMYGFHKINRTPRAQRTSSDAQTWEFSHLKFLRGRPDLLDEIKRKALLEGQGGISVGAESVRARVELPGEVAAQLGSIRDDNKRMWEVLTAEKRKNERLTGLLRTVWDVVGKGFPGSVPPFPLDLLDCSPDVLASAGSMTTMSSGASSMHTLNMGGGGSSGSPSSPNIYITSPTSTSAPPRFPPQSVSMIGHSPFSFASPGSSPTAPEFGANIHQQFSQQQQGHSHGHGQQGHQHPSIGRTHSFPHLQGHPFDSSRSGSPSGTNGHSHSNSASGERGPDMMDMFDEMSPVGQSSDLHSASSSSVSVNLTGSDGHSPDESSASNGLSAHHGDGPGDEPGSQPITGRGSSKRQRISVSDAASSNTHEDMMMNSPFGNIPGMNMSMGSVSSTLAGMNNPSMINVSGMNGSGSSESLLGMENGMGNMGNHALNISLSNSSLSPPDNTKRLSTRARSDSAPLYHQQHLAPSSSSSPVQGWGVGRPRSGSGLGTLGNHHQHSGHQYGGGHLQRGLSIPSISMPRAGLNGVGGIQPVPSNVQGQGR